jgi:hypothetical protein
MSEDIIEEPQEPKAEKPEKTKLQQFIERLSQYPNKETAKTHILEISQDLKCAKSLGYKALNKIDQFKPSKTEAVEPTAKIPETKPEPLETEPTEEITEAEPEATIEEPTAPTEAVGFREKDLQWMFDKGFGGLAKLTGYGDFALEKEDSQKLGEIWTPILNEYLPDWIPYAPIAIAAITTVAIVAPKVKGYWDFRKKKTEDKPVENPPQQPKQEPPPKEPPKQEPAVPPEKPSTAGFMKNLS